MSELGPDGAQFLFDNDRYPLWLGQNIEQVLDLPHHFLVLGNNLVLLQAGEALQAHLQYFLRLGVRQPVEAVAAHAIHELQASRAVVVSIDGAAIGPRAG